MVNMKPLVPGSDKALLKYVMKNDKKQDIFHSSGYAKSQSGANFGAAGADSFEERKNIEEQRKFIRGYRNSKIVNSFYGVKRAQGATTWNNKRNETEQASNPMDVAIERAKFSASKEQGSSFTSNWGSSQMGTPGTSWQRSQNIGRQSGPAKPILAQAKAPKIPNRRSGI